MKRVKDLDFFKNIRQIREFEFGVFYYFDGLIISEIKEGVVFHWKFAQKAVFAAKEFFGDHARLVYISNRVNNYSVVPKDWVKFYKNRHQLTHYAVVGHTESSFTSLLVERMFFKNSIIEFDDLEDAIAWALTKLKAPYAPIQD